MPNTKNSQDRDPFKLRQALCLGLGVVMWFFSQPGYSSPKSKPSARNKGTPTQPAKGDTTTKSYTLNTQDGILKYLRTIHKQLNDPWRNGVLIDAAKLLPPDHPANQPDLMAEIKMQLNEQGQPAGIKIFKSSGCNVFDNSALRVMSLLKKLPPLPAQFDEGYFALHWKFFRDSRACDPQFAKFIFTPLAPEEYLRRALNREDIQLALQILEENGGKESLLVIIGEAGLASSNPQIRKLALQVASPTRVQAVLETEEASDIWEAALKALVERKISAPLLNILDQLLHPAPAWKGGITNKPTGDIPQRIKEVLRALAKIPVTLPDSLAQQLLTHENVEVVQGAAALVGNLAILDKVIKRLRQNLATVGPLAVRKRSITADPKAEQLVRAALAGNGKISTLEALSNYPLPVFAAEIEALVKSGKTPPNVRIKAIEALAKLKSAPVPLYIALRADQAEVQMAAIKALREFPGKKLVASYRLADVAFQSKGAVAAEALTSLATLAEDHFREDTLRRMRYLDGAGQAKVAGVLWHYGETVVPILIKLLKSSHSEVRQAAMFSLARIPSEQAQEALRSMHKPKVEEKISPLERLVRRAVLLSGQSGIPSRKSTSQSS